MSSGVRCVSVWTRSPSFVAERYRLRWTVGCGRRHGRRKYNRGPKASLPVGRRKSSRLSDGAASRLLGASVMS